MNQKSQALANLPASIQKLVDFLIDTKNVKKLVLFGSRARGTARENSDYDIAGWVQDRNLWSSTMAELENKNITLLPVDLVIYDELSADYKKNINSEGVVLYG